MASHFKSAQPDWDATLPPRGYVYEPFAGRDRSAHVEPFCNDDLIVLRPSVPENDLHDNDRVHARIGLAAVIMSVLIVAMIAAQFLRSYRAGVL